jgi:hypothetical protein
MKKYLVQTLVRRTSQRLAQKKTRAFCNTPLPEIAIKKALSIFLKEKIFLNSNCFISKEISNLENEN